MMPAARHAARSPLVVELVGPAGAGKTTLANALVGEPPGMTLGVELPKHRYPAILLRGALRLAPAVAGHLRDKRWLNWGEIRSMVYLQGWHDALSRPVPGANAATAVLLDHGPIFRLARLRAFGPALVRDPRYKRWWCEQFDQWIAMLDGIVWLDAPDSVLVERIRTRLQRHEVKDQTDAAARLFLARYRQTYNELLERMEAHPQAPEIIRVDSHRESVAQIAARVLAAMQRPREQRAPDQVPPR